MKNKWLLAALLAGNSWFGGWATDVDPVIMRVNNKDIHKSEFEYIYNLSLIHISEPTRH